MGSGWRTRSGHQSAITGCWRIFDASRKAKRSQQARERQERPQPPWTTRAAPQGGIQGTRPPWIWVVGAGIADTPEAKPRKIRNPPPDPNRRRAVRSFISNQIRAKASAAKGPPASISALPGENSPVSNDRSALAGV